MSEKAVFDADNGGQGDTSPSPLPTSDGHHDRADMRLVRRAARERWKVPAELRGNLHLALAHIVCNPLSSDRDRIGASKVLVQMEGQNQTDDHLADKNERLDGGKSTENVGVVGLDLSKLSIEELQALRALKAKAGA
jgi:hypothetical protein